MVVTRSLCISLCLSVLSLRSVFHKILNSKFCPPPPHLPTPPSGICHLLPTRPSLVQVLLYVHRNRGLIRNGSPGRPPRLSHSSPALTSVQPALFLFICLPLSFIWRDREHPYTSEKQSNGIQHLSYVFVPPFSISLCVRSSTINNNVLFLLFCQALHCVTFIY